MLIRTDATVELYRKCTTSSVSLIYFKFTNAGELERLVTFNHFQELCPEMQTNKNLLPCSGSLAIDIYKMVRVCEFGHLILWVTVSHLGEDESEKICSFKHSFVGISNGHM